MLLNTDKEVTVVVIDKTDYVQEVSKGIADVLGHADCKDSANVLYRTVRRCELGKFQNTEIVTKLSQIIT